RHVVDGATHLPALNDLLDRGEPFLKLALARLLLQHDLGEDVDRLRELGKIDQRLIPDDNAGGFEPAHTLKAGPGGEAGSGGKLLDRLAPVVLQRGQDLHIDPVERGRSLRGHSSLQPSESSLTATV